jgi:hypothetical protein
MTQLSQPHSLVDYHNELGWNPEYEWYLQQASSSAISDLFLCRCIYNLTKLPMKVVSQEQSATLLPTTTAGQERTIRNILIATSTWPRITTCNHAKQTAQILQACLYRHCKMPRTCLLEPNAFWASQIKCIHARSEHAVTCWHNELAKCWEIVFGSHSGLSNIQDWIKASLTALGNTAWP